MDLLRRTRSTRCFLRMHHSPRKPRGLGANRESEPRRHPLRETGKGFSFPYLGEFAFDGDESPLRELGELRVPHRVHRGGSGLVGQGLHLQRGQSISDNPQPATNTRHQHKGAEHFPRAGAAPTQLEQSPARLGTVIYLPPPERLSFSC